MNKELVIKKCLKCGAIVKVIEDCKCENCGIKCCEEQMVKLVPNTVEASESKHVPVYEKVEDEIFVKVNHVMEKEHYIKWIAMLTDNTESIITLYPEQNAECRFKYVKGAKLYAYCNKHELWATEVE